MKILLTGSTGYLGSILATKLEETGHELRRLDRTGPDLRWPASASQLAALLPEGLDGVIHLAGAPVAGGLWTSSYRRQLVSSRVESTRMLVKAFSLMRQPPVRLLSASAIGIYQPLQEAQTEASQTFSRGLLGNLTRQWEAEALKAQDLGTQVVLLRTGLVLGEGGMLARLKTLFRLGLGGRLGPAEVAYSWIHEEDWCRAVIHLLESSLTGPVNLVAPAPVNQAEFVRELASLLKRPAFMHIPAFLLKLLPGNMGQELFLSSPLVLPAVLEAAGFEFRYSTLSPALQKLLNAENSLAH
jgi:uncharacterized protein (TIGR01777 family)